MLPDLTDTQRALAEAMSDISEEAYCAGWMSDLEFDLWRVVVAGEEQYGWYTLDEATVSRLRRLSEECGGWIVFDDEKGETFVPLTTWLQMFEAHSHQT
jgi:hypothetical protein